MTQPEIMTLDLNSIEPAPYNPREIDLNALEGLKASIDEFGYLDLIIVNKRNNRIISGHQRYKVLKENGSEKASCIVVNLDETKEKALNITMNNRQITGDFTKELIPLLEEIRNEMEEGYTNLKLDELREEYRKFEEETQVKASPPSIPEEPKTRKGDLWILGEHRLLCGDSLNRDDVERLMDGKKASLMATDPPYCIDYKGNPRQDRARVDWTGSYNETEIENIEDFYNDFIWLAYQHLKPKTALYIWYADWNRRSLENTFEKLGLLWHQMIIWIKPHTTLTYSIYKWQTEPCVLGWKKGDKPKYNTKGLKLSNVWNVDHEEGGIYSAFHKQHPTAKPTELFAIPMRVHTKTGEICYEPFSGSGSQIMAGEQTKRKVYAMELETHFCDVALSRWQQATGKQAIREDGVPFDEV